ncbi:hypothetical protein LMB49_10700 [Limosilactobacillus reuteri]|uniref:hypothetical protein n=1 Tax=Limosilactobacillus reuteri TaxID=1598 RepID=UPI001E3B94D5|nr:hypothetical protein [Limosilactobacillus reuteri]MCC4370570.1 hypothetical protein [Limosilactobacillus reuteri]MCC4371861.1 hypothetical protein [Limosilactobacillus reuteri]
MDFWERKMLVIFIWVEVLQLIMFALLKWGWPCIPMKKHMNINRSWRKNSKETIKLEVVNSAARV